VVLLLCRVTMLLLLALLMPKAPAAPLLCRRVHRLASVEKCL
jgi:hypothetical protein